jgi:salicylate hydroxylase
MTLISPSITSVYAKIKTPNKWASKDNIWYDFRWGHDVGAYKGGELFAEIETEKGNVHGGGSRKLFLDGLVGLLPKSVTIQFEKKVVDVIEDGKRTRIVFADGSEAKAQAVIGCDGIHSNARKSLLGDVEAATARYTGKYAYRKVVPMNKAVEAVGAEVENRQMYLGKGGHVLTFPIRNGAALNIVAFKNDDNSEIWEDREWVLPSSREAVLQDFEGWNEKPRNILKVCLLLLVIL